MAARTVTLGQEIYRRRKAAGFSQKNLAKKLGVDRTTVGRWERDEMEPGPFNIKALQTLRILEKEGLADLILVGSKTIGPYEHTLTILAPRALLLAGCKFGVLYIRNGPLGRINERTAINIEFDFISIGDGGEMQVVIGSKFNKGIEFKCFVDFFGLPFSEIKRELESVGYLEPTVGEGKLFRVWFLLPGYRIRTEEVTGIRNNFKFPV